MAITKTSNILCVTYYPQVTFPTERPAEVVVEIMVTIDDAEDDELPINTTVRKRIVSGDDISGEDARVQAICNAVFN